MDRLFEAFSAMTGLGSYFRNAQAERNNTSKGIADQVANEHTLNSNDKLWIVDRILEPQTIAHFLSFATDGRLPGGGTTTLPLLPVEELTGRLMQPWDSWAPEPHQPAGAVAARSPLDQAMAHLGSHEDAAALVPIAKTLHASKSRAWEGLPPLSARRWRDKRLSSDPARFEAACQHLVQAVDVFHYLAAVRDGGLRAAHDGVHARLRDFDAANNALRSGQDHRPPVAAAAALWVEFFAAHLRFVAGRAHAWSVARVADLRAPVMTRLRATRAGGDDGDGDGDGDGGSGSGSGYSAAQWEATNRMHDLLENEVQVDCMMHVALAGFAGHEDRPEELGTQPRPGPGHEPLARVAADAQTRTAEFQLRRKHLTNRLMMASAGLDDLPANDGRHLARSCQCQVDGIAQARREMRGEEMVLEKEGWVAEVERWLKNEEGSNWGFVAYRMCRDVSDEQWVAFREKFDADVADWGEGVIGVEAIKGKEKIVWLDAKELGIEDGDLDGLKGHFTTYRDSEHFPKGLSAEVALVADPASVNSYLNPIESPTPGDFGGFILGLGVDFNDMTQERADESPGYDGTLRILGSLLWDDVYALMVTQTQGLEELWPLAMDHPLNIYTGPVIEQQKLEWRGLRNTRAEAFRAFNEWAGHGSA